MNNLIQRKEIKDILLDIEENIDSDRKHSKELIEKYSKYYQIKPFIDAYTFIIKTKDDSKYIPTKEDIKILKLIQNDKYLPYCSELLLEYAGQLKAYRIIDIIGLHFVSLFYMLFLAAASSLLIFVWVGILYCIYCVALPFIFIASMFVDPIYFFSTPRFKYYVKHNKEYEPLSFRACTYFYHHFIKEGFSTFASSGDNDADTDSSSSSDSESYSSSSEPTYYTDEERIKAILAKYRTTGVGIKYNQIIVDRSTYEETGISLSLYKYPDGFEYYWVSFHSSVSSIFAIKKDGFLFFTNGRPLPYSDSTTINYFIKLPYKDI